MKKLIMINTILVSLLILAPLRGKAQVGLRPISYFIPKAGIVVKDNGQNKDWLTISTITRQDLISREEEDEIFHDNNIDGFYRYSYCLQVKAYKYDGKVVKNKYCSITGGSPWKKYYKNTFRIMKLTREDSNVYYYKVRVVLKHESGKIIPLSQWTKPIYAWGGFTHENRYINKIFKTTVKGATRKKIKKLTVKTPVVKGIKRFKVEAVPVLYENSKYCQYGSVKPGGKITFKNIKIDPWTLDKTSTNWHSVSVYIRPIFKKASDSCAVRVDSYILRRVTITTK